MTIDQIISKLGEERDFGSRYAARVIFTESLDTYTALVRRLKNTCDVTISIADFTKEDGLPKFNKLREALQAQQDKQILLLSVGEYLRMCIKRETTKENARFPDFWMEQQSEASKTRCIMPVFCCRDCFDRVIGQVGERMEEYVWTLDSEPCQKSYSISVYSPQFADAISADANNFEDWLRYWDVILSHDCPCTVVTKQLKNAETTFGTISLKTVDSPFTYLTDLLQEPGLDQSWEPDDFWTTLIPSAKESTGFADLAQRILAVNPFDFVSILARWNILTKQQKELAWIWYRLYPTGEYYSYACKKAVRAAEIPARIRDEILLLASRTQAWIDERMLAMRALNLTEFDEGYFKALDRLRLPEMKLQLLTYKTHEERAYAIKVISGMLREGVEPEAVAVIVKDVYPVLATYLSEASGLDAEVDEYLAWYRKNKLINRFPGSYSKTLAFERFDARLKQLRKMSGKDCFTLWIDGFGMEWLPVFLKELQLRSIHPESTHVTTAILPTETEHNHQWDVEDPLSAKWMRLDSYSHIGLPDDKRYFSCIDHQLSVFAEAAKKVDELLDEHEYVAITGDHGSSRLAALAFHEPSVVPFSAPAHSTIKCFGRFCELVGDESSFIPLEGMKKVFLKGKTYIVMNDHRHFKIGGNISGGNSDENDVVGEIHGGNTPEERLVPVIIIKRMKPLPPLTCKPASIFVTKRNGHIETVLEFSRGVYALEVSIGNNQAICERLPDGKWSVALDNIAGDDLALTIVANGAQLPAEVMLKVKTQGIAKNDGLRGLP